MLFVWRYSCETNLWQLNKLLFANTYVILANKVPKWQIDLPTLVKNNLLTPVILPPLIGGISQNVLRLSVYNSQCNSQHASQLLNKLFGENSAKFRYFKLQSIFTSLITKRAAFLCKNCQFLLKLVTMWYLFTYM